MALDRRSELHSLYEVLKESICQADPEKRSALAGQMRAILAELEEIPTPAEVEEVTGLSEFQRRLSERRAASAPAGKAAR